MRKTERPATRRHVMIADDDWEFLEHVYGTGGIKPIGVSKAIRLIVGAKVRDLRAKAQAVDDAGEQE
jgi:hypothetical protein